MKIEELRNKVAGADSKDLFDSYEWTFSFPQHNFSKKIKGITAIYEYLITQIEGWRNFDGILPEQLKYSKEYFEKCRVQIDDVIANIHQSQDYIKSRLRNLLPVNNDNNRVPFLYNAPETNFLMEVFKNYRDAFNGAYAFIIGNISQLANDKNAMIGILLAYEFTQKDKSQITERRNAEKISLGKIRSEFQNYLSSSELQLTEHLKNANKNYEEHIKEMDELKSLKEKSFNEWFKESTDTFNNFTSNTQKQISDLKKTYEELLKLKKPAEYWRERSVQMKNKGHLSLGIATGMIFLICIALYFLLWQTPEGMIKSFFGEDKGAALRWSVVFITFLSAAFFGIRPLMKITFSNYHLARDAEERERLMFVYLAMIQDSKIEKEDRQLIMQALFSRADTGLLREDSSPTMPGINNLLDKVK